MSRSQVASSLRSLCVSVLESDIESRNQLESAVGTIAARLSQLDAGKLQLEAQHLSQHRAALQERVASLRDELSRARADEYRDVTVSGKSWMPSDAARWVAKEKGRCSWVPSPVSLGAPLPLSESELIELYSTNQSVPIEAERYLRDEAGHEIQSQFATHRKPTFW